MWSRIKYISSGIIFKKPLKLFKMDSKAILINKIVLCMCCYGMNKDCLAWLMFLEFLHCQCVMAAAAPAGPSPAEYEMQLTASQLYYWLRVLR